MTDPTFGLTFVRDNNEPRPVVPSDLSVIGLVLPSADADAGVFPLNTPVEFNSNDATHLAGMGTGPLFKAISRINSNLADLQVAARVVAVRVAEGVDIDATITNIIGSQVNSSGLYALLTAGQLLGVIPRLIGAPGFTGKFERTDGVTGVVSAEKAGGNTGDGALVLANPAFGASVKAGVYQVRCIGGTKTASAAEKAGGNTGDGTMTGVTADANAATGAWRVVCHDAEANGGTFVVFKPDGSFDGVAIVGTAYDGGINFTLNDGAADFVVGDEFVVTVADAVPANGGVFSVIDPDGVVLAQATVGVAYDTAHLKFTINDGAADYIIGDGFDLTVTITGGTAEANPICAALPAICAQLLGHAIVGGPGTTKQDAIDWRETINSQRLIAVDNWERVQFGANPAEDYDGAASALGLAVRVDFQHRGVPSHSFANQPVQGILGLKRYDAFSLVDGATDAQILLANNIGVTVRGELGVETAIASNGFVFVGTDNAGDDELWRFYNQTRMDDYIHLALLKAIRKRLGTTNITPHGIQAVLNDMTVFGLPLKADEHVLSWKIGFEKDKNTPENLRLGRFRVFYATEIPAPLRRLDIDGRRDREALTAMLDTLIAQANTLVA